MPRLPLELSCPLCGSRVVGNEKHRVAPTFEGGSEHRIGMKCRWGHLLELCVAIWPDGTTVLDVVEVADA